MIENQYISKPLATSWTINNFNETKKQKVIRKFINSAIYVEKAVTEMPPQRKTSPLSVCEENKVNNGTEKKSKSICNEILKTTVSRKTSESCYKSYNNFLSYPNNDSYSENNCHKTKACVSKERSNSSYDNIYQNTSESRYMTNDPLANYSFADLLNSSESIANVEESIVKPGDSFNMNELTKSISSVVYIKKITTETAPQRKTSSVSVTNNSDESQGNNITEKISENSKSTCDMTNKNMISRKTTHIDIDNEFRSSPSNNSSLEHNGEEEKDYSCKKRSNLLYTNINQNTPESGYVTNDQSSNHSSSDSSNDSLKSVITVKEREVKAVGNEGNFNSELRLSLSYLNTNRTDRTFALDPKEKDEIVQNWIAKKELEKKRKALQEAKIAKQREEERQKLIEKERENFKRWLAEKKKEELKNKLQKKLNEQQQKLKEAERVKRKVANEISFNLWLRKKKKYELERKIREKLALLQIYERKQIRMEESEKAYQEWLQNSKNRQKPIPMNRGLQSLCSSASVAYINPLPWTPNIDTVLKPSSQ